MPRNPVIEFDTLQMFCGEPYTIDLEDAPGKVVVYSPTMGDIINIGEKRFYQTLNIFVCNTTQYRAMLWDLKPRIDWNTFPDFYLFIMLIGQADKEVVRMLFGDLDFSKFDQVIKQKDEDSPEELILWDAEDGIEINADVYNHFSQYLRAVFSMNVEEKITDNETLKSWYITKDKRALENAAKKKDQDKKSNLQAIISTLINHPGFKYKLSELKEVGVAEFYDSVKRLQVYEQSTALMKGMYSGFIDGSKIKPEDYNFMREV